MPRQIAILTDIHGLLEPTIAILEDIEKRGIKEIYSLGDNIGLGPNPNEVMDILNNYQVTSIAGNYEDSMLLGCKPYLAYMYKEKIKSNEWTKEQLTLNNLAKIKGFPHTIFLNIGNKKIALCHFSNDVRFDFLEHGAIPYGYNLKYGHNSSRQFAYTNTFDELKDIAKVLGINPRIFLGLSKEDIYKYLKNFVSQNKETLKNEEKLGGYLSFLEDPLFYQDGKLKMVNDFDAIIQGHYHFKAQDKLNNTKFYLIRAAGMGSIKEEEKTLASYVILTELEDGFNLEEVLVPFDYEKMAYAINNINTYDDTMARYTRVKNRRF